MRGIFRGIVILSALCSGNAMAEASLHLAATAGLSAGGDKLAEIVYTNGDSASVKAGGLFYFGIGPSVEFKDSPLSMQLLLGRHLDSASAENGDMSFERTTLDAQIFYRSGNHRFGIGVVNHSGVEYEQSGFSLPSATVEFKDTDGMSLEYNWMPVGSHFGVSLRGVKINYEIEKVNGMAASGFEANGDHLAVGLYLYL